MTSYTYDGNSNVATATYANRWYPMRPASDIPGETPGLLYTFTYDNQNRVTQQKIENAASPPVTQQRQRFPAMNDGAPGFKGLPSNTYGYSRSDYAAPKTYLIAYHVPDSAIHGARRHGNTLRFNPDYPGRAMSIGMNADAPVFLSVNSNLNIAIAHAYDGLGRLVQTTRTVSSTPTEFHHVRDGLKVVGNIDYTNSQTAPTWTNKPNGLMPVRVRADLECGS